MKENDLKEMCRISMIGFLIMAVLFFVFILSSCGSHKLATKSDSVIQKNEQTQITDTTSVKQVEQSKKKEETTEVITTTKTEYDTDKPINPETGKPPIKSEETTTTKKETSKKAETSSKTETNKGVSEGINRSENSSQKTDLKEQKTESTQFKQIGWCFLGLAILLLVILLIVKKIKKSKVFQN